MKDYNPYLDVKRIVFSKNEKFMVLITSRQAAILKVNPGKFEVLGMIDLPKTMDYATCDHETLR